MVPDLVTGGQGKHCGPFGIMVLVLCGRGGDAGGPRPAARARREARSVAIVTSSEDTGTSGFAGAAGPVLGIPVSAGALIFDRAGRLLILKPTYKSGWTIPGGVMEADGETPWEACRRAPLPDALALLREPIRRRVRAAIRGRRLVYLEDGRPVPGVGQPTG